MRAVFVLRPLEAQQVADLARQLEPRGISRSDVIRMLAAIGCGWTPAEIDAELARARQARADFARRFRVRQVRHAGGAPRAWTFRGSQRLGQACREVFGGATATAVQGAVRSALARGDLLAIARRTADGE